MVMRSPYPLILLLSLLANCLADSVQSLILGTLYETPAKDLQTNNLGRIIECSWSSPLAEHFYPYFDGLDNQQGSCVMEYSRRRFNEQTNYNSSVVNALIVDVYDPLYRNTKYFKLTIDLENLFDSTKNEWVGEARTIVEYYKAFRKENERQLTLSVKINESGSSLAMAGKEVFIIKERPLENFDFMVVLYLVLLSLMVAAVESVDRKKAKAKSSLTVLLLTIKMSVRSVFYLWLSLSRHRPYGPILLFIAVVNTFCLVRMVDQYSPAFNYKTTSHRCGRFMCCLLISFYYCEIMFMYESWFLIAQSLILVPQILTNLGTMFGQRNRSPLFHWDLVFMVTVNQLFVLYYTLNERNILQIQPDPSTGYTIIMLLTGQICILKFQQSYYQLVRLFRKKPTKIHQEANEGCPICFEELVEGDRVGTPCGHLFHEKCLQKWLQINNICPLDRRRLDLEDLV